MYSYTDGRRRQVILRRSARNVRRRPVTGLGSFTDDLVEDLLPLYREQIKKYEKQLYKQGQQTGKAVADALWGRIFNPPPPSPPSGPKWLPKVINPVINPFVAGLKSEVGPKIIAPAIGIGLLVVGGIFGIGYFVGRRSGRRSIGR